MAKVKLNLPGDGQALDVQLNGSSIVDPATALNFTGAVGVTDNGSGEAEIEILPYFAESQDANSSILQAKGLAANIRVGIYPKGNAGVAFGKENNSASGNQSFANGDTNTASGDQSFANGSANTSSGTRSFSAGSGNIASASRSIAIGAYSRATGSFSSARGNSKSLANYSSSDGMGRARLNGARANSGTVGELYSYFDINAASTDNLTTGDTTFLGLQGGEGAGNLDSDIVLNNDTFWKVKCMWIAVVESISGTANGVNVGDYMVQVQLFGVKKVGVGSPSLTSVTTVSTHGDASLTGSATLVHSIVGFFLTPTFTAPTFTGGGTLTMRIHAQFEIVEIAFS